MLKEKSDFAQCQQSYVVGEEFFGNCFSFSDSANDIDIGSLVSPDFHFNSLTGLESLKVETHLLETGSAILPAFDSVVVIHSATKKGPDIPRRISGP
ncbi:hypothetical protein [Maridesulfovibrio sp.]|uniref:hypothetical protein n=1 Tax=unclassified Maridesulfovibrio TaxID=2794999 RepID=UPI003B002496